MFCSRSEMAWAFVVAISLVLLAHDNVAAQGKPFAPPENILYEANIVYGKGGDSDLKLDLARPKDATAPLPCIVVIHGGAWRSGDKSHHRDLIVKCAQAGYVAATIQYRFCPKHVFPAQIEDAKCAVRFLRASAERFQIDARRIGAVGFSAGAHLSMLLGVTSDKDGLEGTGGSPDHSSRVQAVVAFFGPTELDAADLPMFSQMLVKDFLGGTVADKPDVYKRASPLTYVTPDDAPTLIYQGTNDPLIPHSQAVRMADALSKAGVAGRVELLLGANHGWGGDDLQHSVDGSFAFFARYLKAK